MEKRRQNGRHLKSSGFRLIVATSLLVLHIACAEDSDVADGGIPDAASTDSDQEPEPLITDFCDEDPMIDVDFAVHESGSFRIFYLPGTSAETDLDDIVEVREVALDKITDALGVTEDRTIDVYLTPSRLAAQAHNTGAGMAFPDQAVIEVLYLDDPMSYERVAYGHELTHVVAFHIDKMHMYAFTILSEGLAEFLDQSGRNMHRAFVQECRAAGVDVKDELSLGKDESSSLSSYAKAGSFVAHLFSLNPTVRRFKTLYRKLYVDWDGVIPYAPDGDVLDDAKTRDLMDDALNSVYGFGLDEFTATWEEALQPFVAQEHQGLPQAAMDEIGHLLEVRAWAITAGDADSYRSTMEGFYCDALDEDNRMFLASAAVTPAAPTSTSLVDVFDLGVKNYRIAEVVFDSTSNGATERLRAYVERYPVGWRFQNVRFEPENSKGREASGLQTAAVPTGAVEDMTKFLPR